jgi:hypothetical protein
MHRKLIHSLRALGIALSFLTAGLYLAGQAPIRGELAATATTTQAQPTTKDKAAVTKRHRRTQAREAMVLPFFSFAQGLRRGKRS